MIMDLDDIPVGRVLTRRETLALLGSTGALLFLSGSTRDSRLPGPGGPGSGDWRLAPTRPMRAGLCVVRPASTAGPYYVDEKLNRTDIRSDPTDGSVKQGALLALTLNVSRIAKGSCSPLEGAIVDLWQCDAKGVYSDAKDAQYFDTIGKKFLRGYQVSDKSGVAKFTTIYPGWYPGRTPHIHYKIRSPESANSPYEFVGQMYFDEGTSDRVYAKAPYAGRGKRNVSNLTDRIYNSDGGRESMMSVKPAKDGYSGTFEVALEMSS
jgi:protocatechuate 3,4-dioxygenase beta subunit